jgi:hypothetical protein
MARDAAYIWSGLAVTGFMTAAAVKSGNIRHSGSARRIVVFIAMLAFALQSFVTQTHIHGEPRGISGVFKIAAHQSPAQSKAPFDNSRADCPFCQAIIHAGAFVTPAAPLLYLPFVWIGTVALVFTAPAAFDADAHDWKSRAPPRA